MLVSNPTWLVMNGKSRFVTQSPIVAIVPGLAASVFVAKPRGVIGSEVDGIGPKLTVAVGVTVVPRDGMLPDTKAELLLIRPMLNCRVAVSTAEVESPVELKLNTKLPPVDVWIAPVSARSSVPDSVLKPAPKAFHPTDMPLGTPAIVTMICMATLGAGATVGVNPVSSVTEVIAAG